MTELPLRSISISDFRRLEGTRTLPLDAPIVLLHGNNGAGKTSVLSALELALTGNIRSMRRQDPRYTAHLPFHGREFATLSVEVSEQLSQRLSYERMTVGGDRIEGAPALTPQLAQFYAERCYLDQVSLGQLLDLYQYREGKEESALARFVNELLGLEQLDALRLGLADADDFRRLRKLSEPLANADAQARKASTDLDSAVTQLRAERDALEVSYASLQEAMVALGYTRDDSQDLQLVNDLLRVSQADQDLAAAERLRSSLTALGGRIEGLSNKPSAVRIETAKAAVTSAAAAHQHWLAQYESAISSWRTDAAGLGIAQSVDDAAAAVSESLASADRRIARQSELQSEALQLESHLEILRSSLAELQNQLASVQQQTGTLAEGLAALREHSMENICPVCDRAFDEVSVAHLPAHIDNKIQAITDQGVRLRQLREQRGAMRTQVERAEQALEQIRGQLMPDGQLDETRSLRTALVGLRDRLDVLQPAMDTLAELESRLVDATSKLRELEAFARETQIVDDLLTELARELTVAAQQRDQPLRDRWKKLDITAAERVEMAKILVKAYATAAERLRTVERHSSRVSSLEAEVARISERKSLWDGRVEEARSLQSVAKSVRQAATGARADIVRRVFTDSLNQVWRSVFTRLAPRENFVPMFGIPTATKTSIDLTLRTVHTSGSTAGSPQMMLSAGNLNTAALSLFIALHLAVEPLVPCLVFDDPVQAMDEVHITQFAGLMRILSKQHSRQIVVAVHERELFEYLALELSPAFEGDRLITIELGGSPDDTYAGVKQIEWKPDPAIAV